MTATILDGKAMSRSIQAELTEEVAEFIQNNAVVPCLAAILVGEDPTSEVYVRNKRKSCERVGMESRLFQLPAETTQDELLALQKSVQKTMVFVSHDVDEALKIGNRIAILREGRVMQVGTPKEIVTRPSCDYVRQFVAHINEPERRYA